MLKLALIFLVISLVAGLLGFTGIAQGARRIALFIFVLALIVFVILLVVGLMAGAVLF